MIKKLQCTLTDDIMQCRNVLNAYIYYRQIDRQVDRQIDKAFIGLFLLIKKEEKILVITVIINASTSSSHFYYGPSVEAEDIQQICVLSLSFSSQI